jgi:hypothetical protein
VKELHPDGSLFQAIEVSLQPVPDNVGEELLTALACLECGAVEDGVKFVEDRESLRFTEGAGIGMNFFPPGWICSHAHGTHHPAVPAGYRTKWKPQRRRS